MAECPHAVDKDERLKTDPFDPQSQ